MIKYLGRWDNFSSIELAIERFFVQNERTDTPQFDTAGVGRIIQVMETVSMREPV